MNWANLSIASRATVFLNFVRNNSTQMKRKVKWKDGVKYGQVTYFPRHPNQVDPPIEPTKLLMVTRVKHFYTNPWWEKDVLKMFGLGEETRGPVIVKNIPEICALLWKVKHLVKITPIQLPNKMPTADDLNGTYLHENGTFSVIPKVDAARVEAAENYVNDVKKLNRNIIKEKLRQKWLEGRPM